MLKISDLKCNHEKEPFGIINTPVFSWKLTSDEKNTMQTAYQLVVESNGKIVLDTEKIETAQSVEVAADGLLLVPAANYIWVVTVWDNHGNEASAESYFETAPKGFTAQWIEPENKGIKYEKPISIVASTLFHKKPKQPVIERLMPVTLMRKEFRIKEGLSRARVYATAHGVYELSLNGRRPDERMLAPDYTTYSKYLCYQTYDITELLKVGQNAVGVLLADGWWGGRIGMSGECGQYGLTRGFLMQMELDYQDGTHETVISDGSFRWSDDGPIRYSDIFIGEMQDNSFAARVAGFDEPGFDDTHWQPVVTTDDGYSALAPQIGPPILPFRELPVKKVLKTVKGETVIDFGQNFAGYVKMKLVAPKGTTITLEHSEILDAQGNYLNNIMGVNKDQTDVFVCAGLGEEIFIPRFTFHGFRYVRVTGLQNLDNVEFTGVAVTSQMDDAGTFKCSNELLNRLYSNVRWSQYSNMVSIPTDCPQRERAGWTGDIGVFAPTAIYNQDMQAFLTRWMTSLADDQFEDGMVPNIIPYSVSYQNMIKNTFKEERSAGWSDACIIVPYTMYKLYADTSVLKQFYPVMQRWLEYVQREAEEHVPDSFRKKKNKTSREVDNQKYLWNTGWHYGDWLIPSQSKTMLDATKSGKVTKEIIAPMYFAYTTQMMAEISEVLGFSQEAEKYHKLHERIKIAFEETYISNDGAMQPDLQGIYVCALWHDLVPENLRQKMVSHLTDLIAANGNCLDTGFLATPVLLDVLMKYGRKDVAYTLLYQDNCPSWLYEIRNGATTIWENWSAVAPNGKISNSSYNHYALGCVCDWIYRNVTGIRNNSIAYQSIEIKPDPDETLEWAESSHETVYGQVFSHWEKNNGTFTLQVRVPCNTTATVVLPDGHEEHVGSGDYSFTCPLASR